LHIRKHGNFIKIFLHGKNGFVEIFKNLARYYRSESNFVELPK